MIAVILYQIFVICLAYKNASWSNPKESWKIKHWFNGLIHVVVSVFIGWGFGVELAASNLLLTRVIFDFTNYSFRHLGLGYVSKSPKAILDRIERQFIFWLAGVISDRIIFPETFIERIAFCFRLVLLIVGLILLFV